MDNNQDGWAKRFELTICTAGEIEKTIPAAALGVAVVYADGADGETVFLVIESRSGSLLAQVTRRLQTAKFPEGAALRLAFRVAAPTPVTPEEIHAACREQVIFAGALRRELRPAMR
jgi:hypothetical protein